uniref:(northern house mosquito) hypothetical protein n=1 Tax=Culex pipiens TaxID=7175 RepID=A0A8D8D121_CULPI
MFRNAALPHRETLLQTFGVRVPQAPPVVLAVLGRCSTSHHFSHIVPNILMLFYIPVLVKYRMITNKVDQHYGSLQGGFLTGCQQWGHKLKVLLEPRRSHLVASLQVVAVPRSQPAPVGRALLRRVSVSHSGGHLLPIVTACGGPVIEVQVGILLHDLRQFFAVLQRILRVVFGLQFRFGAEKRPHKPKVRLYSVR